MESREKIRLLRLTVCSGFLLACAYHFLLMGYWLGYGYPFNTFLFNAEAFGSDFFNVFRQSAALNPYLGANMVPSNFFPFTHLALFPLTLLGLYPAYFVFSAASAAFFLWLGLRYLRGSTGAGTCANIFLIIFLSYPFLFQLERGNVEILSFACLFFFALAYRNGSFYTAAFLLSLASAMKPFPLLFLLLFAADGKYRQAVFALLSATALTLAALLVFQNGVGENWACLRYLLKSYNHLFAENNAGLPFGHSLFGLIKLCAYSVMGGPVPNFGGAAFRNIYLAVALACGASAFLYLRRETVFWKRIAMPLILIELLPFVSGDYKLINLFIPLFLFVGAEPAPRSDRLYALAFALLLVPKSYWHFWGSPISSCAVLTPLLLLWLGALLLRGLPPRRPAA